MKHSSIILTVTLCLTGMLFSGTSVAIQKCQDADGKWHYGDVSVAACENSKITTLNDRGFIKEEEAAPKTEEELLTEQALKEKEEAEMLRVKLEEEEKLRILSIYETEADIDRQRDNQISSVDGNILVHEAYLKSMATRIERLERDQSQVKSQKKKDNFQTQIEQANGRVEKSANELEGLREQKEQIMQRFKKEKEIYLSLKKPN